MLRRACPWQENPNISRAAPAERIGPMSEQQEHPDEIVIVHQCQSWKEFISKVRVTLGKPLGRRLYQGQSNPAWFLSSIFERWLHKMKGGNPQEDVGRKFEGGHFLIIRD